MKKEENGNRKNALKLSLETIENTYNLKVKELTLLYKKKNNMEYSSWVEKVRESQEELMSFARYSKGLESEIKSLDRDKKQTNNEKLILSLYTYLDALANKIVRLKGSSNLPIGITKQIEENAWAVLLEDLEEANTIIDIISLMMKKGPKVRVLGLASVLKEDAEEFKERVLHTRYFNEIEREEKEQGMLKV